MEVSWALLANAVIAGLLLGGFYAAMSVGISISFGMLDVVNIAHPAFIILGSYIAYIVNERLGVDPIAACLVLSPLFFVLGLALYRVYYLCFEKRGQESLRGLAFFFGILFITEVALVLIFGVDYRMVQTAYSETTWRLGPVDFPMRLVVPFLVSVTMVVGVQLFLSHTFFGRAVLAVAQDQLALRLMGVNPTRVKEFAFALSIATAGVAGAVLFVLQPVQPAIGREDIRPRFFFSAAYTVLQFVILATAWNILGGYTGYVNFGSAAFFATGAYSTVFLYKALHAPLLVMIVTGTLAAGLLGLAVGYLTLRLRGVFFAIATLALAAVLHTFVVHLDYVCGGRGPDNLPPRVIPFGLP